VSEGGGNLHTTSNTEAMQIVVGNLYAGSTYCWRFSATNYAGASSQTAWASVTTLNTANAPAVTFTGAGGSAHSISVSGEVQPNGLDWSSHLDYFPIGTTIDCAVPTAGDLANVQRTSEVSSTDHAPTVPVSGSIISLPVETDYCVRLVAKSYEGTNASLYNFATTLGEPAVLTGVAFDNGANSISYTAQLTPNTTKYFAYVQAEYFKKTGTTCAAYAGAVITDPFYNDNLDGWSGNTPQAVAHSVTGLATDTTYCIRLNGVGPYSSDTSDWALVTTVQPKPVSISNVKLGPPSSAHDADLSFSLDDRGAVADVGGTDKYSVHVYEVPGSVCNDQDYNDGPLALAVSNVNFNGAATVTLPLDGLPLGAPYCVTVVAESAWGDEFDTTTHTPTWFGQAPSIGVSGSTVSNFTDVSTSGSVSAGYLATHYSAEYFGKQIGVSCADDTESQRYTEDGGTVSTGLGSAQTLAVSTSGLPSATALCFRLLASNYWGEAASPFAQVTTGTAPVDPTISNIQFGAAPNGGGAKISADVNDNGAEGDTGDPNSYGLKLFGVSDNNCNAAGVAGQTALYHESQSFSGSDSLHDNIPGLGPGSTYCAAIKVTSAWPGHQATGYLSFVMAAPPGFGTATPLVGANSVQITSTLSPTWIDTTYKLEWTDYDATLGCDSGSPQTLGAGSSTGSASASATQLVITVLALQPEQKICTRLVAENAFGAAITQWAQYTTLEVTPPSIPTGLTATNVTQTSGTISWTASTDNVGVTGYSILEGGGVIGTSTGTTYDVTLTCGVTKNFTVTAHDAQNNTSDASTSLAVTGAACPVVNPPGQTPPGDTNPPPAKKCFTPFSKTVKGKNGKKKFTIKITGTPSSDGQSTTVKLKLTGGVVAAIVVAAKKSGKKAVVTSPTGVSVTYKVGKKKKTLKLALTTAAC
jgi:hypothetical protein